jgi:hypothetical protein
VAKSDAKADENLTVGQLTKSINFPKDGVLLRKVEEVAEKAHRGKFSPACLALLEFAIKVLDDDMNGEPDPDKVDDDDWPLWLRTGLDDACRITGLGRKATTLEVVRLYLKDYIEAKRAEMAAVLHYLDSHSKSPPKAR